MQLFEFMDLRWYPDILRNLQTNILQVIMTHTAAFDSAAPYIDRIIQCSGCNRIIDLCSGASGPWPRLYKRLTAGNVQIMLTDKHPNVAMFSQLQERCRGRLTGITRPVDALHVPADLRGVRTIFTAFHHFREHEAQSILTDAQGSHQPLCIFDYVPNKFLTLALFPITYVISFLQFYFLSFAVRPFSWKQLLFTNLIPVVPLVSAWDGFVSALRKYDAATLKLLIEGRSSAAYSWEVGTDNSYSRATPLTYVIGVPTCRETPARR